MRVVVIVVVVVLAIALMVARRIYGEPLRAKRLLLAPLIELAIGGYEIVHGHGMSTGEWISLVATGALSLALGAVRGTTLHLFERRGYLWQRYRPRTLIVWAVAFAARFGVRWVLAATGVTAGTAISAQSFTSGHGPSGAMIGTLLVTSGLGFLGESAVLTPRALATGVPLMPAGMSGGGALGGLLGEVTERRRLGGDRGARPWGAEQRPRR